MAKKNSKMTGGCYGGVGDDGGLPGRGAVGDEGKLIAAASKYTGEISTKISNVVKTIEETIAVYERSQSESRRDQNIPHDLEETRRVLYLRLLKIARSLQERSAEAELTHLELVGLNKKVKEVARNGK